MFSATQDNLACHLLKLEQQLKAYEKLHAGEVAEMWHTLNECKQAIADIASSNEPVEPTASKDAEASASSSKDVEASASSSKDDEADACSPDNAAPDSRG